MILYTLREIDEDGYQFNTYSYNYEKLQELYDISIKYNELIHGRLISKFEIKEIHINTANDINSSILNIKKDIDDFESNQKLDEVF